MLKDASLIIAFLSLVIAVSQLRFSRFHKVKNLQWVLIAVTTIILVMQTMNSKWLSEYRNFMDTVFWVSFGGIIASYLWIKKYSNASKK